MASIQNEELVCPRPPCFKYLFMIYRPIKFLGSASRKDQELKVQLDANASFKEDEPERVRKMEKRERKTVKCSLLKFL
jgi:hypothetical protein